MKLSIQQGNTTFSLELDSNYSSNDKDTIKDLIAFISKEIFGYKESTPTITQAIQKSLPKERTTFRIRDRLPNYVVNLEDLTIKQAVTKSALVRCPHCGQAHAIMLSDNHMMYVMRRNFGTNEFETVASFDETDSKQVMDDYIASDTTPESKLTFFLKLQQLFPQENKDFGVDNDTEIFCPVCCRSDSFYNWKDAYENKQKYFEHQYVCNVCGGECDIDMSRQENGKDLVICEDCGRKWLKEQVQ